MLCFHYMCVLVEELISFMLDSCWCLPGLVITFALHTQHIYILACLLPLFMYAESCYKAKAGLTLTILLPWPEPWDYKAVPY